WVPGVRFREREQRLLERFIFMRVWLKRSEQEERLRFEVRFRVKFGSWRMERFSGVGGKRRRLREGVWLKAGVFGLVVLYKFSASVVSEVWFCFAMLFFDWFEKTTKPASSVGSDKDMAFVSKTRKVWLDAKR
ncbi:MAG: hypothetical protein DRP13_02540, partial [Candidatus Aenigmatarchaeota archaeon]